MDGLLISLSVLVLQRILGILLQPISFRHSMYVGKQIIQL